MREDASSRPASDTFAPPNPVVSLAGSRGDGHSRISRGFAALAIRTSLRDEALDAGGWVVLLRARWGVENNSHHLWDTVFAEDHKTWITADPRGALNILLLRRIAANMLALFRGRTLRGEFSRTIPWADLIRKAYNALIAATSAHLDGLRPRRPPPLIPA